MQDKYIKEKRISENTEIENERELIRNIIRTREQIKVDTINFEYAKDGLIDYYIYKIKANQAKLEYLIGIAKIKGLRVDMIKDKKIKSNIEEEAI